MTDPTDDRDRPSPDHKRPPEPAMHQAAKIGDVDELSSLLSAGADIEERADIEFDHGGFLYGLTPLMVAARSVNGASVETLKWLVEHGADPMARSVGGVTAAWYAAGDGGRWYPCESAVLDHMERLRYLLDLGIPVTDGSDHGRTLLIEACRAGDPDRVRLLLERGASADADPALADTMPRMPEMPWDALLAKSDVPRGQIMHFAIPIFAAAESGSADCARLLLDAGVDANTRDDEGRTPLMKARGDGVVRTLVDAGADLQARSSRGKDVLDELLNDADSESEREGVFAAARAMLDLGVNAEALDAKRFSRLNKAAFSRNTEAVDFLIQNGSSPRETDDSGRTPLHQICWHGQHDDDELDGACERIIRTLVDSGADIEARDSEGYAPLHDAAEGDWPSAIAIRTLLDLGASVDPISDDGDTPLHLAMMRGSIECVELLLERGADIHKKGRFGKSAIESAAARLASLQEPAPDANPQTPAAVPLSYGEYREQALKEATAIHSLITGVRGR
ncbi:MAG: ankyrin repeat domain-containing protein [bacterium]|nr:ankyrin repeat domain-containing protein [bacterium]